MLKPPRLLGFAFANADLLFEVDEGGRIVFATGATAGICNSPSEALVGTLATAMFGGDSARRAARELQSLASGGRAGPLLLKLAGGGEANLSLCRLPLNGTRISCTLTKSGKRAALATDTKDQATGLATKDAFIEQAAELSDASRSLSIVNVRGLSQHISGLPKTDANSLLGRIGEALKGLGAKLSGRLGESMFGAVTERGAPSLGESMRKLLALEGLSLPVEEAIVALGSERLSADQRMLALRYVVQNFNEARHNPSGGNLAGAFDKMLQDTQARALQLTKTVSDGDFKLAFMPIVHVRDQSFAHFECLARFESQNTGETIQFAEAMGISDAFDFLVAARVLTTLEGDTTGTPVAFNLSGRTLQSPASLSLLMALLSKKASVASRAMIEITETAEVTDLAGANVAVQAMRALGYRVGLDDFGAGAASFQYLQHFNVDFVKFDGALVRRIGASKRDDLLLDGLLKLCRSLGVETIAEGIEDEAMLARIRELGFDLAQGYHFGRAISGFADAQSAYRPKAQKRLKRRGVKESWG